MTRTSRKYSRAQRVCAFLSMVAIKGPAECWLWTGATYNCGYGVYVWRDKNRAASRVMWEIANGQDVPDGMDVCHTCDVRLCVNPDHLWLGTAADNMRDMYLKGRNPQIKLKPDEVREIRRLLREEAQLKQGEIGARFGVGAGVVSQIKLGKAHKHVI